MSELINKTAATGQTRWQLLSSVAVCTLLVAVANTPASAGEDDRPTVWIELGGQFQRLQNSQEPFLPAFLKVEPRPNYEVISPEVPQRLPRYAISGEGKLTFTPHGTDWSLSAGVRYGRANGKKSLHQQTSSQQLMKTNIFANPKSLYRNFTRWGQEKAAHKQSYLVADFTAGRDVGIGSRLLADSQINFGVRFAQFSTRSTVHHSALPDPHVTMVPTGMGLHKYKSIGFHHSYFADLNSERTFHGIGPSLSWDASARLSDDGDGEEITFDWGVNGALLFGRQKVGGSYQTTSRLFDGVVYALNRPPTVTTRNHVVLDRSHSRIVPNLGGFAGMSFKYPNAKVSFGYRADFFFGAMDVGLAARKTDDRSFHGPFAKVSIGLGG